VNTPLPDPRIAYPAVSEHIANVIRKATEKDVVNRFQSCREFALALVSSAAFDFPDESKEKTLVDQEIPVITSAEIASSVTPDEKTKIDVAYQPLPVKKSNKIYFVIPVLLVFFSAVGFFAYNLLNNDSKKEATIPASQPQPKDSPVVAVPVTSQPVVNPEPTKQVPVDSPFVKTNTKTKKDQAVTQTNQTSQTSQTTQSTQTSQTTTKTRLVVRGNSLPDFASKVKTESERLMKGKGYQPENIRVNMSRYEFSCDLVPAFTSFVKIGLYYAPIEEGWCPPCNTVLTRNPGSEVIREFTDNSFQYNFIAISQ
jgi:hypothetical protein